jgi:hypothetical protein
MMFCGFVGGRDDVVRVVGSLFRDDVLRAEVPKGGEDEALRSLPKDANDAIMHC